MYMSKNYKQHGFTLIEIAIVLLVVTILLGYTVAMFPVQQELKQYREANREMNLIIESLIGFAQVNGRLPCPDTIAGGSGSVDGLEDTDDAFVNLTGLPGTDNIVDGCKAYFGYLPAGTLGLNGNIKADGTLLDPWGNSYRYAVSDVNADSDSVPTTAVAIDLVSPSGIREEGLSAVKPDLFICSDSPVVGNHTNCPAGTTQVAGNVAAVIISTGKDRNKVASNIQAENTDNFDDGTLDKVYISSTRSNAAGAEYDDIVKWISPNILFSKMIEADQLP